MHTIDYVVTKAQDTSCVKHASTLPSIDNCHMLQDHLPSAATFVFQAGPANREAFSFALQQIPSQAWDKPLDAHYASTAAAVFQAIKSAFPKPKLVARRPHISVDTLHLSAEVRSLLRVGDARDLHRVGRRQRQRGIRDSFNSARADDHVQSG